MSTDHGQGSGLELFVDPDCRYCRKVTELIDQVGMSVRVSNVRVDREALDRLEVRGGRARVPCLFVGDELVIFESEKICRYLVSAKGVV